jgi:hypothetical protein
MFIGLLLALAQVPAVWAQERQQDSSEAQRHNVALSRRVQAFDTLTFSAEQLEADSIMLAAVPDDSTRMQLLRVLLEDAWLNGYRHGTACGLLAAVRREWAEAVQRLSTEKACLQGQR